MRRFENIDFADNIYLSGKREPVWRMLLFDRSDPLYKIVLGNYTQKPLDITSKIALNFTISESNNAAATLSATLSTDRDLTPQHFLGKPIIKIEETDQRILSSHGDLWITVFIGPVLGQPGFHAWGRGEAPTITISAMDRSIFYNKRLLASRNFNNGEDFGDVGVEIGTNTEWGMKLQREEIDFGKNNRPIEHTYISIREVPYMEGLNLLFFIDNKHAVFGGDGKLRLLDMSLTKAPVRIYQNMICFKSVKWPQENVDVYNRVRIIGLASAVTKQVYPRQVVAKTGGTIGYFQSAFKEKVTYGEDGTQRAEHPRVESFDMNGWLSSIARGDVELSPIDDFSFKIKIKCPYNMWVFIVFFIIYIYLYAWAAIAGIWYPVLAFIFYIAAAIWLCVGLMFMQQLGQFTLEVSAVPYQNLYKEIEAYAEWSHLEKYEIRELTIENHLVNSQALADTLAQRELEKEAIKGHPRSISMLHDPLLEPDDIIEIPDGSRYKLQSISKTYNREGVGLMSIRGLLIKSESDNA